MTAQFDEAAIEAAIDRLHAHRRAPGYEQARSEFVIELDAQLPACLQPLLAVGERRLQRLTDAAQDADRLNYGLHLIFDFFEGRRLLQIRALVERALQNARFHMKERYIQTLEGFGDPASVQVLVTLLSLHRGNSIEEEDVRVAVLHALAASFPALADPAPVFELLSDESLRVRIAALQYVSLHPDATTASVIAAHAQAEADPDLLANLLEVLGQVDPAAALALAEDRLASTAASEPELVGALQLTIGELRARSHQV